jgi:hypothetical protein
MKSLNLSLRSASLRWTLLGLSLLAILVITLPLFRARAANPPSGAIGPTGPVPPFTGAWDGTATGGSSPNGESTCIEGVNCDTFILTVSGNPTDYAGKLISVKIDWQVPADDYDLYIHKTDNAGPVVAQSAGGAPSTEEAGAIDPEANGTGAYSVHVVYFTTPVPDVDQYHGTATIENKNATRSATYVSGGIAFSPNVTVKAPVTNADGEPSSRTDKLGNFYVSGIRGFPAGIDLWYVDLQPGSATYDPFMRNWIYRGQPDAFSPVEQAELGGDGGGDVDLAVSMPDPTTGTLPSPPVLASSSLIAANISTQKSTDKGQTYTRNNAGNVTGGVPVDDRQWEEFYGPNTVYLYYRSFGTTIINQVQRSDDGGLTFGPATTTGVDIGQAGYIDVHQASGTVYVSGSNGQVCVGTPASTLLPPVTYTCTTAASDPNGVAHLFFPVKVADDGTPNGTAYVAYSNDHNIYLVHSTDKGATWSAPVQVNDPSNTNMATNLFPWLETGSKPGSVGIAWYGTSDATNNDNANWQVFYAQTFNATSDTPAFREVTASDHFIHGSNISEGGLTGSANRNLLDYFQVSFDPNGAAVVGYTDDHNDFTGHTYAMHQISGPGINGDGKTNLPDPGPTPSPATGPYPSAASVGGLIGSQVTDFRDDVANGLLVTTPTDDPLDILSILYSAETDPGPGANIGALQLVARMRVSNLSTVPPGSNWRINFTANAPDSTLSPTGDYTFGVSDRGNQFYVQASSDPSATNQFSYGTAVRNSDGSITYTELGPADCGTFDTKNSIITLKVNVSKLNAVLTPLERPSIVEGSTLVGLRGSSSTTDGTGKTDITRGGTQYTLASHLGTPCVAPTAAGIEITGQVTAPDGAPVGGVIVGLGGSQSARTITDGNGQYRFDDLEANGFYTVTPERANYTFAPADRSFSLVADKTDAVFTATPNFFMTANPLDTDMYFVRQQYLDFLGREPDKGGLDYWTSEIDKCGTDAACLNSRRIGVSAAFFVEAEYQRTGSFVYRLYKGALGRQVSYQEFSTDRQQVIGGTNLDAAQADFADAFVERQEFIQKYGGATTAESFVDALMQTMRQASGADLTGQRSALLATYNSGGSVNQSRSLALRQAIEDASFKQAEYNKSFVLMQYFGYLKRDPDADGYKFWLNVLNNKEPGNYRGMVCSFITSAEYQKRFAAVATHSNQECR